MGSSWDRWEDMPPLVDSNMSSQAPRSIPPPVGATIMPTPRTAPTNTQQYPWGTPYPTQNYTFPSTQDSFSPWRPHDAPVYPQQSAPSPYIPHQPMYPETQYQSPFSHHRRTQSTSNPPRFPKKSNTQFKHSPWPSHGDLSPLDLPTKMPEAHSFTPRAPAMHTPTSTLSRSTSGSGQVPPEIYYERPQHWRLDFKFKSGFASMFRGWSNNARTYDDIVDSSKLDLHPLLRYSKTRPMTIYDMRRDPLTLIFRELGRPPLASDMDHSVTRPPTQYMRIYHSRLPWYIDIKANGASYISLGDFFQQLFAALDKQISKHDFYNSELDDEDRDTLTRTYLERCRTDEQKMEGVKRVDFLRGRFEWMGLMAGKNGMWRLKAN